MSEKINFFETLKKTIRHKGLTFLSAGHYEPGISDGDKMDMVTKYVALRIFILVGLMMFVPFTIVIALSPSTSLQIIIIDTLFCLFLIGLFFVSGTKVPFFITASVLVSMYTGFVCYMLIVHPNGGPAVALWSFILPPLAFYVLGNWGIIPCFVASIAMVYAFDRSSEFFSVDFAARTALIFVFTIAFSSLTYKRTEALSLSLVRSRERLKRELGEIEVMKDNLQEGIFLLDSNFVIQPLYSKFLPSLLDREDLDFLDFRTVLESSLTEKELSLLKDYFGMILNSSFDTEMLEDVNPLKKFSYITKKQEEKVLSISFTQIVRQNDEKALLGVARDITYEHNLEERLSKEEQFRQAEMTAMFEVMNVSPRTLNEFLDELDYEFAHINQVLKEKNRPQKEIFRELFQGVHAMKSNALVIGLESPAARFHEFEDKLAVLINSPDSKYEDLLEIIFEFERVMDIVDNLKFVVKKVESFSDETAEAKSSAKIMIQGIQNIINKTNSRGEKKAVVQVDELSWDELDMKYRKLLKEILLQFTRNSLTHGIEDTDIRLKKGKAKDGKIRLSINLRDDRKRIVMEFSDDGAGIDFEKIKRVAVKNKLVSEDVSVSDRSALIKAMFSPGFSTADSVSMLAGRGVGLSLVADRIKEHKGSIAVNSSLGKGTKFTVELPYAKTS